MPQSMTIILGLGLIVLIVNMMYISYITEQHEQKEKLYLARGGDYNGQTHNIKDWRKIAIELSKSVKNSKLNAMAKYGTDEDIIGLLYLNFGIELFDI